MLKTLTAIAALAALLAFNIAPAHAVLSGDGASLKGGGANGSSAESSALSIDAFELPPQKR